MDHLLGPGIVCSPDLDNETVGWSDSSMKAVGLNTVRIQIGCKSLRRLGRRLMSVWSIIPLANGEPYLEGAYPYLKVAVDWAQTLGLKVSLLTPFPVS